MATPKKKRNVVGFGLNAREVEAYTITNAYCGRCGRKGFDCCPDCRKREQDRIAALEATPGGNEAAQHD